MNKAGQAIFCKTCAGTAMVELAIILPLLLFLLFGITELGRALYQQNMLTQAVELGGRYMARVDGAVIDDGSGGCTKGTKWANAKTMAENLIEFGCAIGDVADGCDLAILPNITFFHNPDVPDDPDNSFSVTKRMSGSGSGSVSACVITVKATAAFQSVFGADLVSVPGFRLGAVTLNAKTHERYIGN